MAWSLLDSGTATFADGSGGHAYSYPLGQPANGDLLIVAAASDTTISTPSGWTLAVSDVVNQGDYLWYRIAGAGEASAVTLTTAGDFPTAVAFLRYSGAAAVPLDVIAAAHALNNDALTAPTLSPAALAASGELAVVVACNQEMSAGAATAPTGSTGYTVLADTGLVGAASLGVQLFAAARTDASGTEAPGITWATSQARNRTALFATFAQPTSVDATVTVPAPATGTASALVPSIAVDAMVTLGAPAMATASALAPTVPLALRIPGTLAGSIGPAASLTSHTTSAGPSRP